MTAYIYRKLPMALFWMKNWNKNSLARGLHLAVATRPTTDTKKIRVELNDKAYVNGHWVKACDGSEFDVMNPSTGEIIGTVPNMKLEDGNLAVEYAYEAFQSWKLTTVKQRSVLLKKWHELIMKNIDYLAAVVTLEMGKPFTEAKGEVAYGADFIEWFSEEAKRMYGDVIPSSVSSKRLLTIKQPVGVTGIITPWNSPNAMVTRHAAPALAAGCTVVIKPAEDTPFSALVLSQLAEEAGFPQGVFNVITSDKNNSTTLGKVLCHHPFVRKLSFTGSTKTGKILLGDSANTVKRVSMELGGNAPFIVFNSADINKAVEGALQSRFRNGGQTCVCANRIMVQEEVHDKFIEKLSKAIKQLRVGDGFTPRVNIGPLINSRAVEKVLALVHDAIEKRAHLVTGGQPHPMGANYIYPTLITDVTTDMKCAKEEIFGPVAAVMRFQTEDEAIKIANNTTAGLAGYFYSKDIAQIWRVAEQLEYGMVGINDSFVNLVEAPFGGGKESGMGREGSKYGLDEYCEIKYMCFGGIN